MRGVTTQYKLDNNANSNICECIAINKALQLCIDSSQNIIIKLEIMLSFSTKYIYSRPTDYRNARQNVHC